VEIALDSVEPIVSRSAFLSSHRSPRQDDDDIIVGPDLTGASSVPGAFVGGPPPYLPPNRTIVPIVFSTITASNQIDWCLM
jgi:hypothetical protein